MHGVKHYKNVSVFWGSEQHKDGLDMAYLSDYKVKYEYYINENSGNRLWVADVIHSNDNNLSSVVFKLSSPNHRFNTESN